MDQHHHISTGPVSSFFMNQPMVTPSPFGSSSLSTASPYSSFFGSTSPSSKSLTVSFPPYSPSFGSPVSSSFSSTCSSFPSSSSSTSSSFYSDQSSFSNASNSFSAVSSPFSCASPTLSPFATNSSANCSTSGFVSGSSSTSPTSVCSARLKHWKHRDYLKESPANQLKNRRDEFVAKFRGIDLSDDLERQDPGANDPAWSWDAMCNQEWDLTKATPKEVIPWYVFDETLSWDEFLDLSERDRIASGRSKPPPSPPRNETMRDIDDDTIDEKEADPWLVKTEILIEPLINISDPNTMLCGYCKQYALQKSGVSKLTCSSCENYHEVKPGVTILMLKHRMLESLNDHKANCPANFSNYSIFKGDIVMICEICDKSYNISKDYNLITS